MGEWLYWLRGARCDVDHAWHIPIVDIPKPGKAGVPEKREVFGIQINTVAAGTYLPPLEDTLYSAFLSWRNKYDTPDDPKTPPYLSSPNDD